MKIISIQNIKGGQAKTTTAEYLARQYAANGARVLAVDADGQGNLTNMLLPDQDFDDDEFEGSKRTISAFLKGEKDITDCIWHTSTENLDVIPSNLDLFTTVYELQGKGGADFILGNALRKLPYDFVVIDNNPAVNKMTFNSIYAADEIICPVSIGQKPFKGLITTMNICTQAMNNLPWETPLNFKILIVMKGRTKITKEGEQQLREAFGDRVLTATIRYQARPMQDAEFNGKSLVNNHRDGVADDYRALFDELEKEAN